MATDAGMPTTPGRDDPVDDGPWAMQLVVRVERSGPPRRTAVLEAAGIAVVRLLADERAEGAWAAPIQRWAGGQIRKHCRRARGAKWEAVQGLPGVTVTSAGAQVRALVPTSVASIYPAVARLQLSGSDLDDQPVASVEPNAGTLAVAVTPDPPLSWPKAAAAVAHAAQVAHRQMPAATRAAWAATGYAVAVEHPGPERWARLLAVAPVTIVDAGYTEIAPGTITALARWR